MNRLTGKIAHIEVQGNLSLVKVATAAGELSSIIIDTLETCHYLESGRAVKAIFKESEVVIGLNADSKVSLQNRLRGIITKIHKGQLLSKVEMSTAAGPVTSHITTRAAEQLGLETEMEVFAMIKTNEVMLAE